MLNCGPATGGGWEFFEQEWNKLSVLPMKRRSGKASVGKRDLKYQGILGSGA